MLASSRMTAHSSRSRKRSASSPEAASTIFCSSSASTCDNAKRLSGSSSTIRIVALGSAALMFDCAASYAPEPDAHHRDQLIGIDGLGDVFRSAGGDALRGVGRHPLPAALCE